MRSASKYVFDESVLPVQAVIAHPLVVEDAMDVCNHARHGRLCVVDISGVDKEDAQRIADFLSGACHGLGGTTSRVTSGIFVVVPPNHRIITDTDNTSGYYGEFLRKASSDA